MPAVLKLVVWVCVLIVLALIWPNVTRNQEPFRALLAITALVWFVGGIGYFVIRGVKAAMR